MHRETLYSKCPILLCYLLFFQSLQITPEGTKSITYPHLKKKKPFAMGSSLCQAKPAINYELLKPKMSSDSHVKLSTNHKPEWHWSQETFLG